MHLALWIVVAVAFVAWTLLRDSVRVMSEKGPIPRAQAETAAPLIPPSVVPEPESRVWRFVSGVLRYGSGEFLLINRPNSGSVVFLRAAITTAVIYATSLLVYEATKPRTIFFSFDLREMLAAVHNTLPWLGAIFAGSYAALYTRFASQWAYLADLYNDLMQAQSQRPADADNQGVYESWKAGFIEDAEEVHLHRKAVYASVIISMLENPGVREKYERYTPGGKARLNRVLREVQEVFVREDQKRSGA